MAGEMINIWESLGYNIQTMLFGIGVFVAGFFFGIIMTKLFSRGNGNGNGNGSH